jgi:hypothetical protein
MEDRVESLQRRLGKELEGTQSFPPTNESSKRTDQISEWESLDARVTAIEFRLGQPVRDGHPIWESPHVSVLRDAPPLDKSYLGSRPAGSPSEPAFSFVAVGSPSEPLV